jgi:AraC family transcriptional activator of pobA
VAHGFRFHANVTNGYVMSFSEDVASMLGQRSGEAIATLKTLAAEPIIPLNTTRDGRLAKLCEDLHQEMFLARDGYRLAMRALLALIAIEVGRQSASRARTGAVTLAPADTTVDTLQRLVEDNFRKERQIGFYASALAMTADRLNDHVKRAAGVTAGHLIRQRVLTEAKRELVFTGRPIHEIAYELLRRSVAFRPLFPQADRDEPAGFPRPAIAVTVTIAARLNLNKTFPLKREV